MELRSGERVVFSTDLIPELDTLYRWVHLGDTRCSHLEKIRLSDSRLPINMEGGWIIGIDSFRKQQLTIIQMANDCGKEMRSIQEILEDEIRVHKEAFGNPLAYTREINEVLEVNGRSFAVIGWRNFLPTDPKITFKSFLHARTIVDSNLVNFEYESCCDPKPDFLKDMLKHLMTIKIWKYKRVKKDNLSSCLLDVCACSGFEFTDLYPDLNSIADDPNEKLILVDSLKSKGFVVVDWGRGNWTEGPRMVNLTMSNELCDCQIDKLYYSTKEKGTFKVTERIKCKKVRR